MTTISRTGNRQQLPKNAQRVCASCLAPRGNVRKGWQPITSTTGQVVGYTCPDCPRWDEPIRRVNSGAGVRFRAVVDLTPPGARKRVQRTRTLPTLSQARAWVAEVRTDGRRAEQTGETVAGLCERWLSSRVDVREVTREGYGFALQPVLRLIGHRKPDTITPADIQRLVADLSAHGGNPTRVHPDGRPLSPRAVRLALTALAQAFDVADLSENVVRHRSIRRPRQVVRVGTDVQHWQPEQLRRFRQHADTDPLAAAAWRLTLSGLTRADVLGLRWSDVELDAGTVTVRQGRVAVQGGRETSTDAPKSAQRRRTVPVEVIHPGTVALLRTLRARQAQDRLKAGEAWHDSGLMVVDALGQPVRPESYSDAFRRLCRAADVPVIRLHSVRHSLAFWLHSLGVPPADAAALLGHTVDVHLSVYLPESGSSGIARAASALGMSGQQAAAE